MKSVKNLEKELAHIINVIEELNQLKDIDAILERILLESRKLAFAQAGSIYLLEDNMLHFRYVQNEVTISDDNGKYLYMNHAIPVDRSSIVGYVADTGQNLLIDDVYAISDSSPYEFNSSYDRKTGFHTVSMMTLPLKSYQGKVLGVLQLINARNSDSEIISFSHELESMISIFARHASVAIERGLMTREMVLRMMKMAELRDPTETGAHVQRVGAYTAEIYHKWALRKNIPEFEIKKNKDLLKIASMLHDVGKIGIPDSILKKPAKLSDEEFAIMQRHTVFGAELFANATLELDVLTRNIALYHHEKWNGRGYPSRNCTEDGIEKRFEGDSIPIEARITALADVFDALSSRRSYKQPWSDEKIFSLLKEESGNHFDPEVVDAFFECIDVIKAIRDKYR